MAIPNAFSTYLTTDTTLNDGSMFRIRDIEDAVQWKNKGNAEFWKFLSMVKTGPDLTQAKHEWSERDLAPTYVIVKKAAASGDTAIDVYDAYQCVVGDVLYNDRTSEIVRIDAVDDADTISVAATTGYGRGHMGTTAAAMRIGDRLMKLGAQLAEEDTATGSSGVMPTEHYNYAQGFQKTWQVTKMQEGTKMLDGVGQIDEQYMRKIWEMHAETNIALYFSRLGRLSTATGNLYSMNGLDAQVKTHSFDFSNIIVPSWEVLNESFSQLYDDTSSSSEKLFFCGQGAYSSLVNAARSVGIKDSNYETLNGTEVTNINVDGGSLSVIKDYRTFDGLLSGSGRIIDPAHVEWRAFPGLNNVVYQNVQANDQKMVRKDMAINMGTLVVRFESTHAIVSGLGQMYNTVR